MIMIVVNVRLGYFIFDQSTFVLKTLLQFFLLIQFP